MFCTDVPAPIYLIFSNSVPSLLYYSHIPASLIALIMGFFVYFKNKQSIPGKILLAIAILFASRSFINLILWTNIDSRIIMAIWSLIGMIDSVMFVLCLYFVYTFIDKKDVSLLLKSIWAVLLLPTILFVTKAIDGFDLLNCEAKANKTYTDYIFALEILIFLWIILIAFIKYKKSDSNFKRQIIYLSAGMLLFTSSFFISVYLSEYLDNFKLEQYGLFGMTVFMGFLAYLIVRYHAFNIKMIATQALAVAMVILIASQFAYVQNFTNKILTGITLALSIIGGYVLVKSVQMEVERKEQLQDMTDKLASVNDKLRLLDNAKSEFISIASHQLRTPLTAVKGYASLLLEGSYGKVDEKQKDVLNKMYQSNERLITLVEDMLNLSRIESGRMEYKFEDIEVEGVLQEIYDTFVLRAKERNLSLELVKSEKPLPKIKTDRNKIREIISNFTDNAIKYTPAGGVKLKAFEKGGKVVVAVSDTGIGIPKGELPYLFEKFSRGKDTSRLNAGGTGLGLHVGIKMIEELKGRIWVESEGAGKGSTFFVELPVG